MRAMLYLDLEVALDNSGKGKCSQQAELKAVQFFVRL